MRDDNVRRRPGDLLLLRSPLAALGTELLPRLQVSPNLPRVDQRGHCEFNPPARDWLTGLGLYEATSFLRLPGEIIGGHNFRNVARIRLQSAGCERIAYLKRDHLISRKDRFQHWRDGYGFSSKCEREARVLQQLELAGLPAPIWLAWGEDGNGKAFLLLQDCQGYIPLRRFLNECSSPDTLRELANRLGRLLAEYHRAGFTMPDLSSKHLLVNPETLACLAIDWQRAIRGKRYDRRAAIACLAKLNATLPNSLVSRRLRFLFLRTYLQTLEEKSNLKDTALAIERTTEKLLRKKSIRKERDLPANRPEQKLIWIDGEAICIVPELSGVWTVHQARELCYTGPEDDTFTLGDRRVRILRQRKRHLLPRFLLPERAKRSLAPLKLARKLFEDERQGIASARLLAFGLRASGLFHTESFAIFEENARHAAS